MIGLQAIMDELRFEQKDNLTLAVISAHLRKIAPGTWTAIGWVKNPDHLEDCILLKFNTPEARFEWQLVNLDS